MRDKDFGDCLDALCIADLQLMKEEKRAGICRAIRYSARIINSRVNDSQGYRQQAASLE